MQTYTKNIEIRGQYFKILMTFDFQPHLFSDQIILKPLLPDHREELFQQAANPQVWELHPNKDRHERSSFDHFFDQALSSNAALVIIDASSGKVIGTTRFYDYNSIENHVAIGYTFLGKDYWGNGYNKAVKSLMFDYAFTNVDHVVLHIGQSNIRSYRAAEKLGARRVGEDTRSFNGEPPVTNLVYQINKAEWQASGDANSNQ